ncbi:MAG: hypothetical protein ABSH40_16495 [Bryobacteraceae bacterium]|jgi:hypothetical protein
MSRTDTCKLKELRAKTDLELVHLIHDRLERGLALAHEAAGEESRAHAERAHREARAWLPLVAAEHRGVLERKLEELGQRLNRWDRRSVCVVCQAAGG